MGGQHQAPASLPRGKRPGTHCTKSWVGPRAGIDGFGKSRLHRDLIPRPSSPKRVAIPTEISRPTIRLFLKVINDEYLRHPTDLSFFFFLIYTYNFTWQPVISFKYRTCISLRPSPPLNEDDTRSIGGLRLAICEPPLRGWIKLAQHCSTTNILAKILRQLIGM